MRKWMIQAQVSWIWDLGGLAMGLLVLFHAYSTKDTAVVVALLVMLYGMIRAQVFIESATSVEGFLALAKRVRQITKDVDKSNEFNNVVVEFAVERGVLHLLQGSGLSLALALIAGARLLVALFLFA